MACDFWRQGFDAQTLDSSRPFTGIHSNPLDSTDVLETFWTRLRGYIDSKVFQLPVADCVLTNRRRSWQWGTVFGDDVLAAAILDRLLHHSHTLMIHGESYRLHQKKKAGLLEANAKH